LRNGGQRERYRHVDAGVNSRLDELQAAVLRARLPLLPAWTARRRELAVQYRRQLPAGVLPIVERDPDYVVVGEGRTLTFEMLEQAVQMVVDGAKLIATNLDPNCPTLTGTRPGCGAIVKLIEEAAGVRAFSVGKPSPVMMRAARKELGLATSETIMIGDTPYDIEAAARAGVRTIAFRTGGWPDDGLRGAVAIFADPDDLVSHLADSPFAAMAAI